MAKKKDQVAGKGTEKCGKPVTGTGQGSLPSSLVLAQRCWSRAIIQTCCSGLVLLLPSKGEGWKRGGVEAVPV